MNNIWVVAMKAVKNQLNSHVAAVPGAYSESIIENSSWANKNLNNNCMFIRPRVEFENNKTIEAEKPKGVAKRTIGHQSIENLLGQGSMSLQHSLNLSEHKQHHVSEKSLIQQAPKVKKYFVPHRYQQSADPAPSNSQQQSDFIENENCYIKSEGNKIIINPKNVQPPFYYPCKNNPLNQPVQKHMNNRVFQAKHDFSCASTQHTKENVDTSNLTTESNKKQSVKDSDTANQTRQKKTVFKTPAFLKNKYSIAHEEAEKNEKEKRLNCSMPKNFKTFEPICYKRDAGIHKYLLEKSSKNSHARKQCISTEKTLKNSNSSKEMYLNSFARSLKGGEGNPRIFSLGTQIRLRIFTAARNHQYITLKIVKLLAENGPTSVYLVIQKYTSFLYCLKKTELRQAENGKQKNQESPSFPNALDYVIRESKIGMSLDHPFLIKTYCTLYDDRNIYQLMEFVEGSTLHNLSRQKKCKNTQAKMEKSVHSIKAIKQIMTELLEGMIYLHQKKIVHRDLKPANIFISNNHAFKIGDFGCSIYSEPRDFVGTLDYVAPEIMLHDPHGTPVDMWAIGCIAYELYTGLPPFYHPKRKQTIQRIIQCAMDLDKLQNKQLRDFVGKLLQKEPTKRLSAKQAYQHSFIQQNAENKIQI